MASPVGTVQVYNPNTSETKTYPIDTSFEPYRREAFRKRTIPPQREAVMMTNIVGEGTVNTEGLWRREQVEWSMGAGQFSIDRKGDSQETRYLQSKGVDVFSYPLQATLLPDTYQKKANAGSNLQIVRCNDYVVVVAGTTITFYDTSWTAHATAFSAFDTSTNAANTISGTITVPTVVRSICSNDSYVFLATDTGFWYCQPSASYIPQLFADTDPTSGYTGGYDLARWANDQLIGSRGARLYAFQPRGGTTTAPYGSPPTTNINLQTPLNINVIGTSNLYPGGSAVASVDTIGPHGLSPGQRVSIQGSKTYVGIDSLGSIGSGSAVIVAHTGTGIYGNGAAVGELLTVFIGYTNGKTRTFTAKVTGVSGANITLATDKISSTLTFSYGYFYGADGYDYTGNFTIKSVDGTYNYRFYVPRPTNGSYEALGGTVSTPTGVVASPDILFTHNNSLWVWSDATGGETQIYFAGYVQGATYKARGCIYRADLIGSDLSSATSLQTITNSSVVQPYQLNSPVQALPMSPDEYPTCIQSYLNFIFIGTNRGIRMAQTLSIYDPTATATGDLKSGPLIPNILQPVTYSIRAIIGDGRFVWFGWSNYDGSSTGLGKLDLSTYIAGDPLAPAYASDIMVTGQGEVVGLTWDPTTNVPIIAVQGLGLYMPYATNSGGIMSVTQYVVSGTLTSGVFDYGISDPKIPVYFDYNGVVANSTSMAASVILDPQNPSPTALSAGTFNSGNVYEYALTNTRAQQFKVTVTLTSDGGHTHTPTLHRWTLKSLPCIVQPTEISAVLQLFDVNTIGGQETYVDGNSEYAWLETRRVNQDLVTYTEGGLSAVCVIMLIDQIPHSAKGTYDGGFQGDAVVTFKTVGPITYVAPARM